MLYTHVREGSRASIAVNRKRGRGSRDAVRLPLLALLAKEPAHGYELKSRLKHMLGEAYPSPNIGQVYLTLQRLDRAGLVSSQDLVQAARPNKPVYQLTPARR